MTQQEEDAACECREHEFASNPTVGHMSDGRTLLRLRHDCVALPVWCVRSLIEMLAASQGLDVVVTDRLTIPEPPKPSGAVAERPATPDNA